MREWTDSCNSLRRRGSEVYKRPPRRRQYAEMHRSKQYDEVIDMMKLIAAAAGIGAIVVMILIAPDISRYMRIRSM
jgi:hypothetical protein